MTTIRASAATTIERDVEDVFAYVADVSTIDDGRLGDGVSGTKLVSGSGGTVGDVYEYTHGGGTEPMRVELTAIERPRLLAMCALEGPFPFEGELTLSGEDGATRVTNTIEPGSDGRFTTVTFTVFGPVMLWLMLWLMRRRLRSELAELKAVLESDDVDPGTDSSADSGSTMPV